MHSFFHVLFTFNYLTRSGLFWCVKRRPTGDAFATQIVSTPTFNIMTVPNWHRGTLSLLIK